MPNLGYEGLAAVPPRLLVIEEDLDVLEDLCVSSVGAVQPAELDLGLKLGV